MSKEIKISLPFYKLAYAVFFVAILSLIRGVTFTYEIGVALEAPMAILAAVFCADAYTQEIVSRRSEIQRLYPIKNLTASIGKRMVIQEVFLLVLAMTGYGLFRVFQHPMSTEASEAGQFLEYLAAIAVTLIFWGILSNTVSAAFRNMWAGMGSCLLLWLMTNSTFGERTFGSWNLFSYTFRDISSRDVKWIYGKLLCIVLAIFMTVMLPRILKKRG